MFDIGPSELILIFIVALLVIGPEKLPGTVRTASLWFGRFRRSFYKIKADVERELNADEIKRQLHNESILADVEEAKSKVDSFAKDIESAVSTDTEDDSTRQTDPTDTQTDSTDTQTHSTETQSDSTDSTNEKSAAGESDAEDSPKSKENSIAGNLKQAVSYVNDISREVKENVSEIEEDLKKTKPEKPPAKGEEK